MKGARSLPITGAVCFSFLLFASCSEATPPGDAAAPFFGPSTRSREQTAPSPTAAKDPPSPRAIALPEPIADDAARRREIWTSSRFRCRAISTTRLRSCRFERTETGWSIAFPVADLTCEEVVFDAKGDPSELRECRSTWLRVPKSAALARGRRGDVWSGSHAGWRWPKDGETYCCPGLWIEAPAALRGE